MSQIDRLRVTDLAAARALRQDADLLSHFLDPTSPSDLAPRLGMAANLVHHHVGRLAGVGLLFEQRREGGKVFYQLTAREYRVPSDLLPPGEEGGNGSATMQRLGQGFLAAYERCWHTMKRGEEDVYGFADARRPVSIEALPACVSDAPYPTHADLLTLRLSPERLSRLAHALSALLDEAHREGHSAEGEPCSLAVLAFNAPDVNRDALSRSRDSFLTTP